MMKLLNDLTNRFILAIIAAGILSLLLAAIQYIPTSQREPDSLYTTFLGLFVIYMIYAGPVYRTAGVIFSFIIDRLFIKQKEIPPLSTYFMYIGWYSIAGIFSALLVGLFLHIPDPIETFRLIILCIIGAILYFHLNFLFRRSTKKNVGAY